MDENQLPYVAYMLRLWLENHEGLEQPPGNAGAWRASLEDPYTHEKRVFADLETLFTFLEKETERRTRTESTYQSKPYPDE